MTIETTLVVPCYNEVTNIQKGVLDKIGNFTKNDPRFKEVIIVDDGSSDETRTIIKKEYLPVFPKFRLIENQHQGKAFAVIRGIKESKTPHVMFSDIDLATPIEEAERLIKPAEDGIPIVIGSRNSQREGAPFTRKVMALGMIIIRSYFIGLKGIKDTQCGFKMFKRDAAIDVIDNLRVFKRRVHVSGSSVSAGFDLEFLFLANKKGYKIKEVSVDWRHVETKNVNFIKDSFETLKDILLIKIYDLTKKYN